MKNSDVITEMVKELSTEFPSLVGPLITERDQFLACKLRSCPGDTIVAVVGTRSPFLSPSLASRITLRHRHGPLCRHGGMVG